MRLFALFMTVLMMTASAAAETIDVKYWGAVDLRTYKCAETVSSFVHRICYDESKAHLVVRLRNTYYPYCRVDRAIVSAWLNSSSKGRFYNANIKSDAVAGRFDCRR
ncbi:KTSC domain-containing protein [Nitratireductor aquimarinus]|uniref:KTSC domain-containing protein n=1 Tax=Nitratireductor aquimarinus TaxID=889300 RepID=UPI0029356C3A|nr:KTSC domain-containing protein [Nitratireductor aquimarinus]MDV2964656.1 KTSC domain-containing protein [Nitratireductor aquimarinus]